MPPAVSSAMSSSSGSPGRTLAPALDALDRRLAAPVGEADSLGRTARLRPPAAVAHRAGRESSSRARRRARVARLGRALHDTRAQSGEAFRRGSRRRSRRSGACAAHPRSVRLEWLPSKSPNRTSPRSRDDLDLHVAARECDRRRLARATRTARQAERRRGTRRAALASARACSRPRAVSGESPPTMRSALASLSPCRARTSSSIEPEQPGRIVGDEHPHLPLGHPRLEEARADLAERVGRQRIVRLPEIGAERRPLRARPSGSSRRACRSASCGSSTPRRTCRASARSARRAPQVASPRPSSPRSRSSDG